jgi:WD40-like Beta Propeller Repeat
VYSALAILGIFSVHSLAQTCVRDRPTLHDLALSGLGLIQIEGYGYVHGAYAQEYDLVRLDLSRVGDVVVGVTRSGDALLVETSSARDPASHDAIEIVSSNGVPQARFAPGVRSIGAIAAEISPDGQKLAFIGTFAFPKNRGINLLTSDGHIRNLIALEERSYPDSFGWSSSGNELVYDEDKKIYIYSLQTGSSRLLVRGTSPTWSPKGDWIAYRDMNGRASLTSPDGSKNKDLLSGSVIRRGLRWSPDGRYLLFANARTSNIQIVNLATNQISNILCPIDGTDESRLRWVSQRFSWR